MHKSRLHHVRISKGIGMGDTSKRDNSNAMTLTDIGGRGLDEEKYAPRNEQKKAKQMGA